MMYNIYCKQLEEYVAILAAGTNDLVTWKCSHCAISARHSGNSCSMNLFLLFSTQQNINLFFLTAILV